MLLVGCASADIRAGRRALARGDFDAATAALKRAAEAEPGEPGRWLELAKAELLADQPARARAAFERLALLRPRDPRPIVEIGFTYELERRYDLALTTYLRAVDRAPDEAYPHRVLGGRLLRWGESAQAIEPLERAVALDAAHAETWKALAMARYHQGEVALAEAAFRSGIAASAEDIGLRLGLAALLINAGRHREALATYDAVLAMRPRFAAAHVGRGILLHELGRADEAERAFERAVEVADDPRGFQRRLEDYRTLRREGVRAAP